MIAKEITINYLESIKKDLDSAAKAALGYGRYPAGLKQDLIKITGVIKIVEEAEGE